MSDEITPVDESVAQAEQFFFDEFFADEGVEVLLPVRGRQVPIRIKRGLTLREKAEAQAVAIKRKVDPQTGRVTVDRIDEAAAAEEVAFRMILSWPFIDRETHAPIPVTRENVSRLLGGMDVLVDLVQKMEVEGDAALAPFVAASAKDSGTNAPLA